MVFAAHILDDPDVTFVQNQVIDHFGISKHSRQVSTWRLCLFGCVVGRSAQQNRGAFRSAGNHDNGVELYSISPRNHLGPANVIEAFSLRGKVWWGFAD